MHMILRKNYEVLSEITRAFTHILIKSDKVFLHRGALHKINRPSVPLRMLLSHPFKLNVIYPFKNEICCLLRTI